MDTPRCESEGIGGGVEFREKRVPGDGALLILQVETVCVRSQPEFIRQIMILVGPEDRGVCSIRRNAEFNCNRIGTI